MCGRYQLSVTEKDITIRFHVEVYEKLYRPSYNCAPSQKLPVISSDQPDRLAFYKWGLIPFWAKDPKIAYKLINAKSETIEEKPSFKHSFKRRRCLVICNGFYEWKKGNNQKIPYRIFLRENKLFAMAGIWDEWKDAEQKPLRSFSILTTSPNELMKDIHQRMPVILDKTNEHTWLHENNPDLLKNLLKPFPADNMEAYQISSLVNSPRNDTPEIIEALN